MAKLGFKRLHGIWVSEVSTKGSYVRQDFYLLWLSKDLVKEALGGGDAALKKRNSVLRTTLPIAYLRRYMQPYSRSRRSLVQNLLSARDTAAEPAYWPHWWACTGSEKQVKKGKGLCLSHCVVQVLSLWLLVGNLLKTRTSFFIQNKNIYTFSVFCNPSISAAY